MSFSLPPLADGPHKAPAPRPGVSRRRCPRRARGALLGAAATGWRRRRPQPPAGAELTCGIGRGWGHKVPGTPGAGAGGWRQSASRRAAAPPPDPGGKTGTGGGRILIFYFIFSHGEGGGSPKLRSSPRNNAVKAGNRGAEGREWKDGALRSCYAKSTHRHPVRCRCASSDISGDRRREQTPCQKLVSSRIAPPFQAGSSTL